METSDFTPEMGMWPFCACTMKNMLYNYRYLNRIGEMSASYRKLLSRNTMVTSYFTADLAMGQIPHPTERIASYYY